MLAHYEIRLKFPPQYNRPSRGRRLKSLGLVGLASQGLAGLALFGYGGHCSLWTHSTKLTAYSVGNDEIAAVSRLSGLSWLNSGPKRWPQFESAF
jgi:hypothetical protein